MDGVLLRPFKAIGVDAFLGDDEPKPTGVLREETRPPERMLEVRLTEEAPLGESSESREMFDPVRLGGREPLRPPTADDWRLE